MNVKQFKRRVINGLVEPDLFKMPVGKKNDAFTIEIEVIKANVFIEVFQHFLPQLSSYSVPDIVSLNPHLLMYNLKDENGNFVNKETYPELFWEFPCHGTDYNKKEDFLSENMIENNVQLYFQIDWGDGEKTIETPVQKTFTIRDHTFTYDTIQATDMSNTASSVNPYVHMYKETGIYTVKVSGYASNIEIKDCHVPRDKNLYYYNDQKEQYDNGYGKIRWRNIEGQCFVLRDIISWGDLRRRNFYSTFTRAIADMKQFPINLPFKKLSKVVALEYLNGQMWSYNSLWNCDKLGLEMTWESLGGERFFDNFPNLISAYCCFYYGKLTYIPPYCFQNNSYLINAGLCFYNCFLEYIGEYAFANLKYLSSASQVWQFYIPDELKNIEYHKTHPIMTYIGDSVFENCENLSSDNGFLINNMFVPQSNKTCVFGWQRIGNRVFKNCKKIISGYGNNNSWSNLTYVGDELFAGCENLEKLNYCFSWAPNLEYIGKDIFKGCKKLYDTTATFTYNFFKINIPEKMFYDVEFQDNVTYNFDFKIDLQYAVNDLREKKNNVVRFLTSTVGGMYSLFDEDFYKELHPELYQKLVNKIQNFDSDITYNTGCHFGKNMFNERFLTELGNESGKITHRGYAFDGKMQEYELNNSGHLIKLIFHNRNTGEAPPFWKYGIQPVEFGWIATQEEYGGVRYIFNGLHYDNADEIPKEEPWVEVYPHI